MAEGWVQQGIQIPEDFRAHFRREAADKGHSSIKTLGTIAIGILLGMPQDVRAAMFIWTQSKIARSGDEIQAGEIYDTLISLLEATDDKGEDNHLALMLVRALRSSAGVTASTTPGNNDPAD